MPANKGSRRSISVRGATYARAKAYCESEGLAVSGFVEDLIREALDAAGAPEVTAPLKCYGKREPELTTEEAIGAHFTF